MLFTRRTRDILRFLAAACLLAPLAGCTSAISAAYLRDMPWDGTEHAAQPEPPTDDDSSDEAAASDADEDAAGVAPDTDDAPPPAPSREAAIEEAVTRISRLGTLSAAAQDALVETLRHTEQQDWPVVIDEFAAALASNGGTTTATAPEPASPPETKAMPPVASDTEPVVAAPEPAPVEAPAPEPASASATPAAAESEPEGPVEPEAPVTLEPEPQPEPAPLAIDHACFATRVRGWGAVDRFQADAFRSGQELIVYFELDNLGCGTSAAGHTTCIDTVLTLVDAEGRTLHRWTFEPVTETSPARRRDYFARYVLALPDGIAVGTCTMQVAVTDALSGGSATTALPLEIVAD